MSRPGQWPTYLVLPETGAETGDGACPKQCGKGDGRAEVGRGQEQDSGHLGWLGASEKTKRLIDLRTERTYPDLRASCLCRGLDSLVHYNRGRGVWRWEIGMSSAGMAGQTG
jgi:hypothetical protein